MRTEFLVHFGGPWGRRLGFIPQEIPGGSESESVQHKKEAVVPVWYAASFFNSEFIVHNLRYDMHKF